MNLLYKICRQNPKSREGVVMATSILGIIVNVALAIAKILVGVAASSIAVISDGVNSASDSGSSLITIIGTKLSKKKPTKNHPFGYGRIDYLTSLTISVIILFTGFQFLTDSIKLVFNPEEVNLSYLTLAVLGISAAAKFALGSYTVKMGKNVDSGALVAMGTDARNDFLASSVTIISALIFLIFDISIDAYAGAITSVFILKSGFEIMGDTAGTLLGRPANEKLASKIYSEIRSTDGVLNAADLTLHNYGPDIYNGSVNIEIDHEYRIGDIYEIIHALQLKIMHKYGVTMVFGMYAVDRDHAEVKVMRKKIAEFVRKYEHATSFHALYLPPTSKTIYCDIVVDYELTDWNKLRSDFLSYMSIEYPSYNVELVIETEYV